MAMVSLPKLNSFLCFEVKLGIKILSLVLIVLGFWPPSLILAMVAGSFDNSYFWIVNVPIPVNVITFGLAFAALQWNKTRVLLIPAAVLAPIWSIVSLICFVGFVQAVVKQPNELTVFFALLFLLDSILLAYYWVGLITLYGHKKPAFEPLVDEA